MTNVVDSWKTLSFKIVAILQHSDFCAKQDVVETKDKDIRNYVLLTDDDVTFFLDNSENNMIQLIEREHEKIDAWEHPTILWRYASRSIYTIRICHI